MATTPRKTQTPGAKTTPKAAEVKTTAPASAEDALDAALGKQEAPAEPQETAEDVLAEILSGDAEGQAEGQAEAPEGFIALEQFDAVVAELTEVNTQLAAAQSELIKFKNDIAAMLGRVAELQGKAQPAIANQQAQPQ
ncbi:MAG: hypothetical protein JNJ93_11225, partial [Acinetobacter sp.]|nr:hypothetical protein [Acinetobacter sp.]